MNPRLLLIDDERSFRLILKSALDSEGFNVRTAATLAEGQAAWSEEAPDVVIIDRNLPDGDGVELLAILRKEASERNLQTTFIVVTAYADVDNAVLALQRGADDYITKPVQLPDLLTKLRKARERRALERQVEALRRREPDVVTSVLIHGESGSGKDLMARLIHSLTPSRCNQAMVELNCAAITEQLAESELFGHERGAFTDAKEAKRGLLELADESTLFLDEIADLGPNVQGKLLRVLETMRFRRVGGTKDREVNVRVISATHQDLNTSVEAGRFRLDLFHRLDVFHLELPALRERPEDILSLAEEFLRGTMQRLHKPFEGIDSAAAEALKTYAFPGNVRELKNIMERAAILQSTPILGMDALVLGRSQPQPHAPALLHIDKNADTLPTLKELEALYVAKVLDETGGNKTQAAKVLGITFPTITKKIRDYDL